MDVRLLPSCYATSAIRLICCARWRYVSPGNAGFFHSDSTPVVAMQLYDTGGTPNLPILVVKSADDLEKLAPLAGIGARIAGALGRTAGKKKLGKVGVTSATAGTTGKTSLDQAMDMATDSGPPAAGFGTKTLENTATSAPKQSMANLDGGSAAVTSNAPTHQTLEDFGVPKPTQTSKPMEGKLPNPQNPTGKPTPTLENTQEMKLTERDIGRMDEMDRVSKPATVGDAERAAEDKSTYNVPKPLQRIFGEKIDRDVAQNVGAAGLVGVQQMRARGAQKDAAREQEMQRIEAIAADGRAKANTGAKVAVA